MNEIKKLYEKLLTKYGQPEGQWKLWCKRPKTAREKEEIVMGAILTQRTNWKNVEQAIANLKGKGDCSLAGIYRLGKKDKERLMDLFRPSGFYRQKSERLFNLASFIIENYKNIEAMGKIETRGLREELLGLKGLGPETVDDILLYALEKPVFVIDEYTKRLVKRRKLAENFSYDFLQSLFEENLPKDYRLFQDFHALIVIEGKTPIGQKSLFFAKK